ncbi:Transcription elongation factor SPT4 [Araneus ventricosus]|uniref:Transcription elongation factor SPT4 n=1 Tax=Araneus ventricosus TaxID=182803 RepID=A0A4Y2DPW2_ARAVE|nr:Transcription elongation factor SPT4 [Araneus ventricosus]
MSLESIPKELRNLRACLLCSMIKTFDQFEYDGCDNCEEYLNMKGNRDMVAECTSSTFDGPNELETAFFLLNLNGILLSEGMRVICGIKYVSPFSEPMRFAFIILCCNLVTIKRVPLHKSFVGAKFRNNIIMHSGFKFDLDGGIPASVKELRNFTGNVSLSLGSSLAISSTAL